MSDIKITLLRVLKNKNRTRLGFCSYCNKHNNKYVECKKHCGTHAMFSLIYKLKEGLYIHEE